MNNKSVILGSHNGIHLIRKEDGAEFYYSTHTDKTALTYNSLSRFLGCSASTVSRLCNKLSSSGAISIKKAEMYTEYGLKTVALIVEDDLPKILSSLATGRANKKTKQTAIALQEKLAQAGFRLMVLMEVAPELVAKEAISNIESPETAESVTDHAIQHEKYLKRFWGLQKWIQETGASHGAINGHKVFQKINEVLTSFLREHNEFVSKFVKLNSLFKLYCKTNCFTS
ncbi:hypothetical protein [Myxosarcina sp. GI1(2024)]